MDSSDQMDFGLPGSAPMPDPPATADGPPKEAQAAPRLEPEYGWIKMQRNPDLMELVGKNHHAAILLLVIAFRAWRGSGFNRHGLSSGQAFLGKFKADYSMTEKEYRNAKKVLEAEGFATFQRASKGTIATLCDARIFDINPESEGGQRAIRGRSEGGQGANAGRMQGDQRDRKSVV